MSFSMMHIAVDGTLANPFVAVAMGILCVLSFLVAYRVARGPHVPRVLESVSENEVDTLSGTEDPLASTT